MKLKFKQAYMNTATQFAQLSTAVKLKVGAVIVKDNVVIFGYNGTPAGWDNNCEDKSYMSSDAGGWLDPEEIEIRWPYTDGIGRYKLITKPEVLHAEMNCLAKITKSNLSTSGAVMFITHSPCIECAKSIYQSGIVEVYYETDYKNNHGVEFLEKCGVSVHKLANIDPT